MEETVNYLAYVLEATWDFMQTEFTIYGFTLSYAKVFIFTLICGFLVEFIRIFIIGD